jgi:hypothetical protein
VETPKKKKPKKVKKPKEKPLPPASPTPKKPEEPTESVQSSDIYVALKLDTFSGPPTEKQIEQLRKNTRDYFVSRLKEEFPTKFAGLDLNINLTAFGVEDTMKHVGQQDYEGMNVYIEWITEVDFRSDDAPMSPTKRVIGSSRRSLVVDGLPTPYELTRAIVRDCDIIKYLLEYVRVIEDSDFTTATACHLQQRIEGKGGGIAKTDD